MNDNTMGFGKFVPGFDFLQNLAKGAGQGMPQMPHLSSWVAPTLNLEELDKRIGELKAVQFWLEQNGKALAATIQALEVQKMTLATLQGMNFDMGQMAEALKVRPAPEAQSPAAPPAAAAKKGKAEPAHGAAQPDAAGAAVDPLQWWSALTQQFQEIAGHALQDVAEKTAAAGMGSPAPATRKPAKKAAGKPAARKGRGKT